MESCCRVLTRYDIIVVDAQTNKIIDNVIFSFKTSPYTVIRESGIDKYVEAGDINEIRNKLGNMADYLGDTAFEVYRKKKKLKSTEKAKEIFYENIPQADGWFRIFQLVNVWLLKNFDEAARRAGTDYWISHGTLIGAVRHKGFIPWDDDIDVIMLYDDILRLYDYINTEDAKQRFPHFEISVSRLHVDKFLIGLIKLRTINNAYKIDVFGAIRTNISDDSIDKMIIPIVKRMKKHNKDYPRKVHLKGKDVVNTIT